MRRLRSRRHHSRSWRRRLRSRRLRPPDSRPNEHWPILPHLRCLCPSRRRPFRPICLCLRVMLRPRSGRRYSQSRRRRPRWRHCRPPNSLRNRRRQVLLSQSRPCRLRLPLLLTSSRRPRLRKDTWRHCVRSPGPQRPARRFLTRPSRDPLPSRFPSGRTRRRPGWRRSFRSAAQKGFHALDCRALFQRLGSARKNDSGRRRRDRAARMR